MAGEDVETQTVATKAVEGAPAAAAPAKKMVRVYVRGTCIGRYVILDRLGIGGMGVVYRAFDPDLDRQVALKLVRAVSAETTARMIREAQALAKVSHPNIVQIFDVGTHEETVFIAMELVEGKTLVQWAREVPRTWREVLAHVIDAGHGLAAAHAAGIIHRDFKPSNVIVGADGRVRVLDFGLARQAGGRGVTPREGGSGMSGGTGSPSPADSNDETASALELPPAPVEEGEEEDEDGAGPKIVVSRITGTPMYMAPEQRRHGTIDARADQFAFGVSAWELLYGERPFAGENARAYAEATLAGRLRPPPAGNKTPAWVRRVLVRCMAPAAADRYRSIDDALVALGADPARRWRTIAALAVVAAAAGGLAFALRGAGGESPCEDAARHLAGVWDDARAAQLDTAFRATGVAFAGETVKQVRAALDRRALAWATMHRDACRATRVSGEQSARVLDLRMACLGRRRDELGALVEQLVTAPDATRVAASLEAVAQLAPMAACADLDRLAAAVPLPDDPMKQGAIAAARAELTTVNALELTGQWAAARGRAERVQAQARVLGWAPLVAEASLARARTETDAGGFAAAEKALGEAVDAAARAHEDDVLAQVFGQLAWVIGYEDARAPEGLAYATAAEAAAVRANASPEEIADIAHTRAQIISGQGDQDAALREAERARRLYAGAEATVDEIDTLNTIAMIRTAQGDYARAEAADREVLARRREMLGDGHPKVADSLDNLGVVRFHQGAYDEARKDYEQALAMRVAALGPDHRDVGTSHNNLGGLLMETGDDRGAEQHLEQALRIYERALGKDHGDLAIPLSNLGELATRRGDFARAVELCARALALDEAGGHDDPQLAYDLVCSAEAEIGRSNPAAAITPLERALKLREGNDGDAAELARTRFDLARALWRAAGDKRRARLLAQAARDGFAAAGDPGKTKLAEVVAWLERPG